MTVRFIHTADWQIGKPFRNFPAGLAGELAAARFSAISRIAAIARAQRASHVLVAGDVFDSPDLQTVELRRALELMAAAQDTGWVLLPGNHDCARPGGLWDKVQRLSPPANVTVLTGQEPLALAAEAVVLPAPLTSNNPGGDPTSGFDTLPTPAGVARIGLAHGSVRGFGSAGESAVQIAPDRAERAGLAYLALGDWHGSMRINDSTWYAGTPEPDRYPDNEPGFVLSVTIENGKLAGVQRLPSAQFTWLKMDAPLSTLADLAGAERTFARLASAPQATLARVALSGSLSLAEFAQLQTWQEVWSARLRHLELDTRALATRAAATDLDSIGAAGPLRDAARALAAVAQDTNSADAKMAEIALQFLFGFVAEAAREGEA